MRAHLILSTVGAAAVLGSCMPTDLCGCSPVEPTVVLEVTVEGPDGAPVAGAGVVVDLFEPTCDGEHRYEVGSGVTSVEGRWQVQLAEVPPPACFLVRATGWDGSGLGTAEGAVRHTAESPLPFDVDPVKNRIGLTLRLPMGTQR